ncbi:SpoIIE family protein phosphatase [uncultured Pseudokineococcus sp.]|uniref:SpoIIE family protein phosphatase n=1 Tax=uncultured Pseudokineococcus sp. TaxID=1642928 RepID=UPI00262C8708|nr:SpoIIE family protein phosphatase [uncultured Pseudokineococcus sp.]
MDVPAPSPTGPSPTTPSPTDFRALFEGLPTAYLVMSTDLVIVEVNRAYCHLLGRTREDLVGRYVFDAFPPSPEALDDQGRNTLQVSFERARDSGQPDALPLYTYGVADPATGRVVERHWSLIAAPLLDEDGRATAVLQRVEDVTDYVLASQALAQGGGGEQPGSARLAEVEAELRARVQELQAAREAERAAARTVTALAEVTLQLARVDTVQNLTEVVTRQGLSALGAQGGAVAIRDGDAVRLSMSGLGPRAPLTYAEMAADDPLPTPVAATTGRRTFLTDEAACRAYGHGMPEAVRLTGCQAWAFLPLLVGGVPRGSLSVGYARPQSFPAPVVEVLDAFAAQCAQALHRIRSREAERARAAQAVAASVTLQRAMLTELPQPDHLQLHARYVPAADTEQVGGDWYDAVVMPDGATTLVIGDVIGHDMRAAAAMGQLRATTRAMAWAFAEPASHVLTRVDQAIAGLRLDTMATCLLARIEQDPAAARQGLRRLRWSSAGHPPPLLLTAEGTATHLPGDSDLLLGVAPSADRHDHLADLPPGSTLLLHTDGLVERRGRPLADGLEALRRAAERHAPLELTALVDALLEDLVHADTTARDPRTSDDVAVLAIRMHPEDAPRPPEAGPGHL